MLSGFVHMLMAGESDDAIPAGCLFEGPYVSYRRQRVAVPKGSKRIAAARGALEMISSGVDTTDLLPGRYDDWVLMERERTRRRPLHALEAPIGIRSGLDDLDEALSWNGSTGTTQLRGCPPDAVALSCDDPRATGRLLAVNVEVRK